MFFCLRYWHALWPWKRCNGLDIAVLLFTCLLLLYTAPSDHGLSLEPCNIKSWCIIIVNLSSSAKSKIVDHSTTMILILTWVQAGPPRLYTLRPIQQNLKERKIAKTLFFIGIIWLFSCFSSSKWQWKTIGRLNFFEKRLQKIIFAKNMLK